MGREDGVGLAVAVAVLLLVMALCSVYVRRTGKSAEVSRKSFHLILGAGSAVLPWVFESPVPVWILAFIVTVSLVTIRLRPGLREGLGSSLHAVRRISYGDVLFAPAVASVFHLSLGQPVLHVIPILVLTFADASGAIYGSRWGKRVYITGEGSKSIEGSLAFFLTAFFCVFLVLVINGFPGVSEIVLISLILAGLATLVEGFSDKGFDNLLLPLGCHFVLERILSLEAGPLFLRVICLGFMLLLVSLGTRWSTLTGGALLAAALLGYGCAVIGDWRLAVPLAGVFLCHVVVSKRHALGVDLIHRLDAVLSYAFATLPWALLLARDVVTLEVALAGVSFSSATQLTVLYFSAHHVNDRSWFVTGTSYLKGWLFGAGPGFALMMPALINHASILLSAFLLSGVFLLLYRSLADKWTMGSTWFWYVKGGFAFTISLLAFGIR